MSLKFNERSHRYYLDGKPVPGVTGILGVIDKPAIPRWAAKTVAEYVADNLHELESWSRMGRDSLVAALKQTPWTTRDEAAVRGTDVHDLAEGVIHGDEVEVPEHLLDYVTGYVEFLDRFSIEPVLTEKAIGNRELGYAGRFDSIVKIPGWRDGLVMMDLKTSRGVYGETALQNAGYVGGEFYVDEGAPDVEMPLPEVEAIAVAHVTSYGTFLHDLGDVTAAQREFRAALELYKSRKRRAELIGDPLEVA